MSQIPLKITHRIPYDPTSFFIHQGVSRVTDSFKLYLEIGKFSLQYVIGSDRTGKSHLSLWMLNQLDQSGKNGSLLEGRDFFNWTQDKLSGVGFAHGEIIIVDNSEDFFCNFEPGTSGIFVNLIESMRVASGIIVFLSRDSYTDFNFDEHIISRIKEGEHYFLGTPDEESLSCIVEYIARQYGIELSQNVINYLVKRIPRTISKIEDTVRQIEDYSRKNNSAINLKLVRELMGLDI